MEIKNLLKKLALIAGSVALLATAGGAISANADAAPKSFGAEDATNPHAHWSGSRFNAGVDVYNVKKSGNGYLFHINGNGRDANGSYKVNNDLYYSPKDPLANSGNANTYINGHYNYANESNHSNDNANQSSIDSTSDDDQEVSQSNSDATQSGNKLVQTGENNGAEYAAIIGAILAVSGVAFAGYDFERKNA